MLAYCRDLVLFALPFSSVGFSLRHNFHAAHASNAWLPSRPRSFFVVSLVAPAGAPLFAVFAKGGMGFTCCRCRKPSGKAGGTRLKLPHRKVGEQTCGAEIQPRLFMLVVAGESICLLL